MKVVIDINDNLYTRLFDCDAYDAVDMLNVCTAVRKGKPLPKGHGRLIDADELIKNWYDEYIKFMTREEIESMDGIIENAPTVIEADKESEDKK